MRPSLMSDISDDDLMNALTGIEPKLPSAKPHTKTAASTSVPAASSSHNSAAPSSFQSAFGSFTSSSMYTSVSNMPQAAPSAPSSTSIAAIAQQAAAANQKAAIAGSAARGLSSNAAAQPGAARTAPSGPAGVKPTISALTPSAHCILVSHRQKGNPVLRHISHVAYEFSDQLAADFHISDTICAVFISVRFHMEKMNYLQQRLHSIKHQYTARVLLVYVDIEESERPLLEISRLAFAHGWAILCCWSGEEVGRYLDTLKQYEKKSSSAIEEKIDEGDHKSKLLESLTMIRSINKTDVGNLVNTFHSFAGIAKASKDDLIDCPGMGQKKVNRLFHVMNQPFITSQAAPSMDGSGTTAAQAAAIHAANIAKAVAKLHQPPKKTGAIQYVNSLPSQYVVAQAHASAVATATAAAAAVAATSSSAASASTSAAPSAPAPSPAPVSSSSTAVASDAQSSSSVASSSAAAASSSTSSAQASSAPSSWSANDFIS